MTKTNNSRPNIYANEHTVQMQQTDHNAQILLK